jgi:hypothetical protein
LAHSVTLSIDEVQVTAEAVRIHWELDPGVPVRLRTVPFEFRLHDGREHPVQDFVPRFIPAKRDTSFAKCAAFALLSVALPLLLLDGISVVVQAPWKWTDDDLAYWDATLRRLGFDPTMCRFAGDGAEVHFTYARPPRAPLSMGLFYGAGIESNAALSALLPYRPTLFIVDGANWMNSNTKGNVSIKRQLEFGVAKQHRLDLVYARTNIRELTPEVWDAMLNHYCTGGMFYWCAAAAGLSRGISLFLISQELEYSLIRDRFDQSLTPHQLFWNHHPEAPLLIPVNGWASSLELFDLLRDSPLVESLYSCFHNTGKRWCGKCGKCYRIWEYARRTGVDPARFGMLEPPVAITEGSQLYRLHWQAVDELFPERGRRNRNTRIGLTDVSLIDQIHLRLFRVMGGVVEADGNRMTLSPRDTAKMEIHFDRLRLRGLDEFISAVDCAAGEWQLSFSLYDESDAQVAEWSCKIKSGKRTQLHNTFGEQFGLYRLVAAAHRLDVSDHAEKPLVVLHLPTLRRSRLEKGSGALLNPENRD